jgi:hypothetical protein
MEILEMNVRKTAGDAPQLKVAIPASERAEDPGLEKFDLHEHIGHTILLDVRVLLSVLAQHRKPDHAIRRPSPYSTVTHENGEEEAQG